MSSKKVTTNANGKKAARVNGNGNGKAARDPFASREVDEATLLQVIDLVIELNRDTLRELAHH